MMLLCDFCGQEFLEAELARLRAIPFLSHADERVLGYVPPVGQVSAGDWAACIQCNMLIKEDAWPELAQRSLEMFEFKYGKCIPRDRLLEYLKELHQEFRRARL